MTFCFLDGFVVGREGGREREEETEKMKTSSFKRGEQLETVAERAASLRHRIVLGIQKLMLDGYSIWVLCKNWATGVIPRATRINLLRF